jgi:hypothetical protein
MIKLVSSPRGMILSLSLSSPSPSPSSSLPLSHSLSLSLPFSHSLRPSLSPFLPLSPSLSLSLSETLVFFFSLAFPFGPSLRAPLSLPRCRQRPARRHGGAAAWTPCRRDSDGGRRPSASDSSLASRGSPDSKPSLDPGGFRVTRPGRRKPGARAGPPPRQLELRGLHLKERPCRQGVTAARGLQHWLSVRLRPGPGGLSSEGVVDHVHLSPRRPTWPNIQVATDSHCTLVVSTVTSAAAVARAAARGPSRISPAQRLPGYRLPSPS